jgi:hypothetical protein
MVNRWQHGESLCDPKLKVRKTCQVVIKRAIMPPRVKAIQTFKSARVLSATKWHIM